MKFQTAFKNFYKTACRSVSKTERSSVNNRLVSNSDIFATVRVAVLPMVQTPFFSGLFALSFHLFGCEAPPESHQSNPSNTPEPKGQISEQTTAADTSTAVLSKGDSSPDNRSTDFNLAKPEIVVKNRNAVPPAVGNGGSKPLKKAESQPKKSSGEANAPASSATTFTADKPAEATPIPAPEKPAPEKVREAEAQNFDAWNSLLQKHVGANGKVNYKGFKADKADFEAVLKSFSENPPQENWKREEKMAFWMNAYNAFTIKLLTDNYPISSILKLDNGKTWDVKRIEIGGKKYSLNQIENEVLRPQFKDARVHFAINCGAKSCPPLLNKAFTAENLNATLEKLTKDFINNPKFNSLSAEKASVSKIFEWYAADFGDLKTYLNRYSKTKLDAGAKVEFQEYDWGLND